MLRPRHDVTITETVPALSGMVSVGVFYEGVRSSEGNGSVTEKIFCLFVRSGK